MVEDTPRFFENLAAGEQGQNYIKTILSQSGYTVIPYGIENHIVTLKKELRGGYETDTQKRLHLMPDFVVIDKQTKEAWLIEVKNRPVIGAYRPDTEIWLNFHTVKDIMELWEDAIILITMPVEPYCIGIKVKDIDWNKLYKGTIESEQSGKRIQDKWNFHPIQKKLYEIFPNVNPELLKKNVNLIEPSKK